MSSVRLLVAAVGTRVPGWVKEGFAEFAKRMPRECPVELIEIRAEPRSTGKTATAMMAAEAQRLRAALPARHRLVVLDEQGDDLTTRDLAERLNRWRADRDEIAFVIGGPDGLAEDIKREASERIRLSSLTLPHALVRVILAEALYRAWTLLNNHPYHRD